MINLEKHSDHVVLVGRLFYSSLFILYGYFKLTGFAGTAAYMGKQGLPAPSLFAVFAVVIELAGGLLMLAGYKTRLVALGLAIYVLAAGLIAHTHFVDGNQLSHFMKNMAIVVVRWRLSLLVGVPIRWTGESRKQTGLTLGGVRNSPCLL